MSKYSLEFLTPAYRDLEKIASFHKKMVGSQSAQRITDKLLESIRTLEDQPFAGLEHPDPLLNRQNYRKLICDDYICIYKVIKSKVFIYRVVHGATDYPRSFL